MDEGKPMKQIMIDLKKKQAVKIEENRKIIAVIKDLGKQKDSLYKTIDNIKKSIKTKNNRKSFLIDNKNDDDSKKQISQLQESIKKGHAQIKQTEQKIQVIKQTVIEKEQIQKNISIQLFKLEDLLKNSKPIEQIYQQSTKINQTIIKLAKQYEEIVEMLLEIYDQNVNKKISAQKLKEKYSQEDKKIKELVKQQQLITEEKKKISQKIIRNKCEGEIFIEEIQQFDRDKVQTIEEFLKLRRLHGNNLHKPKLTEEEKRLKAIQKIKKEDPQLILKTALLIQQENRKIQQERIRKEREERERKQQQERKQLQRIIKKEQQQRQQLERIEAAKAENIEKKKNEELFKNKCDQIKKLKQQINKLKENMQKLAFKDQSSIEENNLNLTNKKQLIDQASKKQQQIQKAIQQLQTVKTKLGKDKEVDDLVEMSQRIIKIIDSETVLYWKYQKELRRKIISEESQKRQKIQQKKVQLEQTQLFYLKELQKKQFYANQIQKIKSKLSPTQLLILPKKQKLINELKLLVELNLISKEQLQANKFELARYSQLVYKKSKLLKQISKDIDINQQNIFNQQFIDTQAELTLITSKLNLSCIKGKDKYPVDKLVKTKQQLFTAMKEKQMKQLQEAEENVKNQTSLLIQKKSQKEKELLLLTAKMNEIISLNQKIAKQKQQQFQKEMNVRKPEGEGQIIPNQLKSSPFNVTIEGREKINKQMKQLVNNKEVKQIENQFNLKRNKRIQLEEQYNQLLKKKKQSQEAFKQKEEVYLGEGDKNDDEIKKLVEELQELKNKCEKIKARQKSQGGISRIELGSIIHH